MEKTNKQEPEKEQKRPWWKELLSYVWMIAFACAVALAINRFVLINAEIPAGPREIGWLMYDGFFGCTVAF